MIKIFLFLILFLGGSLRLYGINWDQGFHLHPDERAIVMFSTPLQFPKNIFEFFSKDSSLNPHFFAYGSFPIYLLKITGEIFGNVNSIYSTYEGINLIGRLISIFADLGIILFIFKIGKRVFNEKAGLIAAFFYAISTLAIQSAHFYIVDPLLTFFVTITLYQLLVFYEKPTKRKSILVGFLFGISLATKNSALVLIFSIGATLIIDFLLIFLKNPHRPYLWVPHIPKIFKNLFINGVLIISMTLITFFVFEPYAVIDFKNFWQQTMQQNRMTFNAFTFPYTLQYVGKLPYFYELKNVFLWGQGPFLAILSFMGILYSSLFVIKKGVGVKKSQELILIIFFWAYFLIIGRFAIGFMRYMLPVYPLFCIFAASFFIKTLSLLPKNYRVLFFIFYFLISIAWPLSFLKIYTKSNTRVLASEWINTNVKPFSKLAVEHWDDRLPLFGQQNYDFITLPLYDPDTPFKWSLVNEDLSKTDYIIIASNRLYIPLQKLIDCQNLPRNYCYPLTAEYYKKLFNGSLGFKKVAEFSSYPTLSLPNGVNWKLEINDLSADESFTVYDHPKIIIFKKE